MFNGSNLLYSMFGHMGIMMNDFTKEELDEIFWILEGSTMDYIGKENGTLMNKIQSLIDSYPTHCEHSGVELDNHKYYLQQQSAE